ncbi:MAG: S-layer homology domain-containing protein, partial [Acidimicrobiia bacterium]
MGSVTALALVTAMLPLGATGTSGFSDIDGNVHADAIERIAALGITKGCNPPDNDLFCPDALVTRGQMAAFLTRTLGITPPGVSTFDDTVEHLFEADIARLADAGITRGCNPPDNSRFCPDEVVTRGQMAAFLVRAIDATAGTPEGFTDTKGHLFEHDIAVLAAFGVTKGCNPPTNSRFCPDEPVSRDQMATFLDRVHDIFYSPGTTIPPTTPTTSGTLPPGSTVTTAADTTTTTAAPTTTTTTLAPPPSGAYLEENGVVVMEVESVPDINPWDEGTGSGAIGSYYYTNVVQGMTTPGSAVLSYPVWITEPGVYVATVRSRRDRTSEETCDPDDPENPRDPALLPDAECVENGERNDIFIRMDDEEWHSKNSKGTTHADFGVWGWID